MKKIIILLAAVLSLSSCAEFLKEKPATKYPLAEYFNNEEETLLYLYGCYYQVKSTVFGTDFMYLTDTMTDDIDYTSTNIARRGVAYLTMNPTNSLVKNVWGKFYAVIEQCNILLDNLDRKPELGGPYTAQIAGEAKFMRAWAYFNLVQLWGDVPIMTKPVYSIAKDNIMPRRSPASSVWSLIVTDLEDICPVLEENPSAISVQSGVAYPLTISRATAKALLGKAYLAMGQWEDVVSTLSYFFDGDTMKANWGLCSHFNYIFDTRYKGEAERSKEVLWEMVAAAETDQNNTWHREVAPSALIGPAGESILGVSTGYQSYVPTYDLFSRYSNTDMRYLEGFQITSGNRPQFMKGYDVTAANQNLGGPNVILLRVADVYLTLAEAYARLSNPAKARSLVNVVRGRAGIGDMDATLTGDALVEAILLERRLEFAGEGAYRLYDLRRTGKYLATMEAFTNNLNELSLLAQTKVFLNPPSGKNTTAISIPFYAVAKNAQPKHLLLPIPADERISNPNLSQNNGW